MKKYIIRIDTAKLLKEIGFDEVVEGFLTEYLIDQIDPEYPEGGGPFGMVKGEVEYSESYDSNSRLEEMGGDSYQCYSSPTLTYLQQWLMEEYKLFVCPFLFKKGEKGIWKCRIQRFGFINYLPPSHIVQEISKGKKKMKPMVFDDYYLALGEGLRHALKIIKHEYKNETKN